MLVLKLVVLLVAQVDVVVVLVFQVVEVFQEVSVFFRVEKELLVVFVLFQEVV